MPNRRAKPNDEAVVALDLGGTKLAAALFSIQHRPIAKQSTALDGRQGDAVGELIAGEARRLLKEAARRGLAVRGVGASVPGIAEPGGRVWAPNIQGWESYPLADTIAAACDDKDVTVRVDSDRAASILGEAWQGAARGCRDAVFIAVGTGIGAGILADGRVLRGAGGSAGSMGWLALDRPFRREYVACGCFEGHASGEGLAKRATALLRRRPAHRGALRGQRQLTAHDVFSAFDAGDEVAAKVVADAIEFWGMASANLVSLFDPEVIIFGGGVFGPAVKWLDAIANEARQWAQPVAMDRVRFVASKLGGDAALFGAARLVADDTPLV